MIHDLEAQRTTIRDLEAALRTAMEEVSVWREQNGYNRGTATYLEKFNEPLRRTCRDTDSNPLCAPCLGR